MLLKMSSEYFIGIRLMLNGIIAFVLHAVVPGEIT